MEWGAEVGVVVFDIGGGAETGLGVGTGCLIEEGEGEDGEFESFFGSSLFDGGWIFGGSLA